jgi:hypothetical protein
MNNEKKPKPKLKNIFLPILAVNRIKKLCAGKAYMQDWMLEAACMKYKIETGLDLLAEEDQTTKFYS